MILPLSFAVGFSMASSASTAAITSRISFSPISFGTNSLYTLMRSFASSMVWTRSAGVVSMVSCACLISRKMTAFSSSSVRSARLSIALFLSADSSRESASLRALSLSFIACIMAARTVSILLIDNHSFILSLMKAMERNSASPLLNSFRYGSMITGPS